MATSLIFVPLTPYGIIRYAFVAGITHSAHAGLFMVVVFVVLGFFLMTRVDFSTVTRQLFRVVFVFLCALGCRFADTSRRVT